MPSRADYVLVLFFHIRAPVEESEDCWFCAFYEDQELERSMRIYGIDSWQALIYALKIVGVELLTSDYGKKGELYCFGDNGYLGLLPMD